MLHAVDVDVGLAIVALGSGVPGDCVPGAGLAPTIPATEPVAVASPTASGFQESGSGGTSGPRQTAKGRRGQDKAAARAHDRAKARATGGAGKGQAKGRGLLAHLRPLATGARADVASEAVEPKAKSMARTRVKVKAEALDAPTQDGGDSVPPRVDARAKAKSQRKAARTLRPAPCDCNPLGRVTVAGAAPAPQTPPRRACRDVLRQLAEAEADMDVFEVQGPQGACPQQEVEAAADQASDCSDLLASSGQSWEPGSITCELARGIVDDLPEDVHERLLTNVLALEAHGPVAVGSLYTGSDLAWTALRILLQETSGERPGRPSGPRLVHTMAVEWIPWKRDYVMRNRPGIRHVFGDAKELLEERGHCLKTGQHVSWPRCDILSLGSSCKDFSSMRDPARGTTARAVLTGSGSSGSTMRYAMAYIGRHLPAVLLLENVPGLLKGFMKRDAVTWAKVRDVYSNLGGRRNDPYNG